MFDRVVVDVVDVSSVVGLVADRMFSVTSLPKGKLTISMAPDRLSGSEQCATEMAFDTAPSSRIVRVFLWQGQDCMKVVGQDYNRLDRKWTFLPRHTKSRAQGDNVMDERCGVTISQR
jgi:hypothetical protein